MTLKCDSSSQPIQCIPSLGLVLYIFHMPIYLDEMFSLCQCDILGFIPHLTIYIAVGVDTLSVLCLAVTAYCRLCFGLYVMLSPIYIVCVQVKWMMYWIVFALFTTVETLTDLFMSW
jgi:hypothetical protein